MWRRRSKIFSVPEIDPIKRSISQVCKFISGALLILAIVSVSDVAAAAKSDSERDSAKKPTAKVQDTNSAFELFDSGRYLAALDRAKELAAAGQPEAHTLIGKIYAEGLGVGRNFTEAASWYLKGSELGDQHAQFALGVLLIEGQGVKKNPTLAADYFEAAAKQGHAQAQYNLALIYIDGRGRPENLKASAKWLREAAKLGNPQAQYDLGTLYLLGQGVEQDDKIAAEWIGKAAASGFVDAEVEFAIMLFKGRGTAKDTKKAVQLLYSAALKGNVIAQNRLARLLFTGTAIKADMVEGAKWHFLARENGISDFRLDAMLARLTPEQRTAAVKAAEEWRSLNLLN